MSNDLVLEKLDGGQVCLLSINRPPHNYFDLALLEGIADVLDDLDADPQCRVVVLTANGKSFCAGANFSSDASKLQKPHPHVINPLYQQALRIFHFGKPLIAAVNGAAIGGGLGLAVAADFRVAANTAYFTANFTRLGFHPGFALTATLPELVGRQYASQMFFTAKKVEAPEALDRGLVDYVVPADELMTFATQLAREIAVASPLALRSTRTALRGPLLQAIKLALFVENEHQTSQMQSEDFQEGILAARERRLPQFQGK